MKLVLIQNSDIIKEFSAHQLKLGLSESTQLKPGINMVFIPLSVKPIHKMELHFMFTISKQLAQKQCLLAGAYYNMDNDKVEALIYNYSNDLIDVMPDQTILIATAYETIRLRPVKSSTMTQ